MNKNLVKALQDEFPWIPKLNPLYSLNYPMSIDCADGWFTLIHDLCLKIDAALPDKYKESFTVDQIKEKMAGLRFYTNFATEEISKIIREAESLSFTICEECGASGSMHRQRGWYRTLCVKCATRLEADLVEVTV